MSYTKSSTGRISRFFYSVWGQFHGLATAALMVLLEKVHSLLTYLSIFFSFSSFSESFCWNRFFKFLVGVKLNWLLMWIKSQMEKDTCLGAWLLQIQFSLSSRHYQLKDCFSIVFAHCHITNYGVYFLSNVKR